MSATATQAPLFTEADIPPQVVVPGWGVVVNECIVLTYRAPEGRAWWTTYRYGRKPSSAWEGRFTDLTMSIAGNLVQVACDGKESAQWLAETMVEHGVPKAAVKVARLAVA